MMLWVVRHEWPSGARFVFNCYRHWTILVVRGSNGKITMVYSKEGVTQGDPLAMFAYGIGVLPLVRRLQREFPAVKQPWYADDACAVGSFEQIGQLFKRLQQLGPSYGYFPEPSKSILVVREHNLERARELEAELHFEISTGNRYLGGFIGGPTAFDKWITSKADDWVYSIEQLSEVAANYPQAAYCGMQKSLQMEWQFVQRVIPDCGDKFAPVEKAIAESFLPALFGDQIEQGDYRRSLARLPVKFAGLAIPDPTESAKTNYEASTQTCSHLIAAIRGEKEFKSADHKAVISEVKSERKGRIEEAHEREFRSITSSLGRDTRRAIARGRETGQWLNVLPSTVNGTDLSKVEFRDALNFRYGRAPGDLPSHCDGCGEKFSIRHAHACKKGGLVIARHDEIRDELADIASRAFKPSLVRDEPLIHPCRPSEQKAKDEVSKLNSQDRGDLLIRNLWARGTDCIIDVRVTDLDAESNIRGEPQKVLKRHEKEKKKKYLEACLQQRRHFSPFVVSTDGLLGREAQTLLKKLSAELAEKWGRPYSQVCGFVRARLSIAIVRATHQCVRGSRIPTSSMSKRLVQWEDGAGFKLFR